MSDFKNIQDLIEVANCQFVSFKYFTEGGEIQQLDIPAKLINGQEDYIARELDINLADSRVFVDPFRSLPTITVFCHKNSGNNSTRARLQKLSESAQNYNNFQASISFWITNNELEQNNFLPMQADPYDLYANLRSEISCIADNIKINIFSHHYGYSYGESVINISAENLFKLAEDIVVTRFIISNCSASYNFASSFVAFNHSRNLQIRCNDIILHQKLKYELLIHNQIELYELLISFINERSQML